MVILDGIENQNKAKSRTKQSVDGMVKETKDLAKGREKCCTSPEIAEGWVLKIVMYP
jgi:hypothetical protein